MSPVKRGDYIDSLPAYDFTESVPTFNPGMLERPENLYSECVSFAGIYGCRRFQYDMAKLLGGHILNAASADDPSDLGSLGAINLDVTHEQPWSKLDLKKNQNFIHGSVFAIPFPDQTFDTVVLGEFLEHCQPESGLEAVLECRRVLKVGGRLIITFPLDGRPRSEQEEKNEITGAPEFYDPDSKVTTYHRTWWSMKMQEDLRRGSRMVECARAFLIYLLTCPIGGWGLVWQKLN